MVLPEGVSPKLIGKVVTINVIERTEDNSGSLDLETMEKYVGTLQSYFSDAERFDFMLVGYTEAVGTNSTLHYVEIHPYTTKYIVG
jgi:hypothetical protein